MMLNDVAAYLAGLGVGTVGTTLFKGQLPEIPDVCVVVQQYAGEPPETTHDRKTIDKPGLQVVVRDPSYQAAADAIEAIEGHLDAVVNMDLSGTRYLSISARQAHFPLGADESGRVRLAQNFRIEKAR